MTTNKTDYNFYFWLGMDGKLEATTEDQFNEKQEHIRKERKDWLNAEANEEQDIGG